MAKLKPFFELFTCAKIRSIVRVTANDRELYDQGRLVDVGHGKRSCSGSPGCGTTLGAPNCPYKTNLNED